MSLLDLDKVDTDAPMFDPAAFGIGEEEASLNALARRLGKACFGPRAAEYDRDARFPTENYNDMRDAGLLGICVPKEHGGLGAGYRAYMTTAAEIGRYCGATALTYNMHVCSCLWTGPLSDDLEMSGEDRAAHQRRGNRAEQRQQAETRQSRELPPGGVVQGCARHAHRHDVIGRPDTRHSVNAFNFVERASHNCHRRAAAAESGE